MKLYFRALAVLAVFLLWGISLLNGTVKALLLAVWHGELDNGTPLKTDYTGILFIDYPIALLVAFFFYGTNGYDEAYQLFLLDAYATLQSAFVWLYIEAERTGKNSKWINRPVVFGLLWQCFGAAISLPLYYAIHVQWIVSQGATASVQNIHKARALPISFLLGAILPAVIGMAPTWLGPESRSATHHQMILAAWQPDPLWVSGIQICVAGALTRLSLCGGRRPHGYDKRSAHGWTQASYLMASLSSAMGHLYVMSRVTSSCNEETNFSRMYVPFLFTGPSGVPNILVQGPWLFLQYDLIIISLSSLSWAYYLLLHSMHAHSGHWYDKAWLALLLLFGAATIGPGATVSLALYVREGRLFQQDKALKNL